MPPKKPCKASETLKKRRKNLLQKQAQKNSQIQTREQATAIETTTVVTQQQSQELTQSLLLASISSILHLRDLMNPACFKLAHFDVSSSEPWSYEDWKTGDVATEHNHHTQSLHLLQRGDGAKSQAFMDYIENGAFDAIRRGFLRSFQLKIFADPDHQEHVLETHTLNFSYHRPAGSTNRVVNGMEMTGPDGKRLSLVNLKIGFAEFVRSLSTYVSNLPELPEQRFFKPKLFYTDDCPDDYQAPGFCAPKSTVVSFPRNEELEKKTHQLNSYIGGFHDVNMSISHMQWSHQSDGAIPAGSDLIYSKPASLTSGVADETMPSGSSFQDQAALSTGDHIKTPPATVELAHQKLSDQPHIRRPRPRSFFPGGTFRETPQEEASSDTISVQRPSWVDPGRISQANSPENQKQDHASSRNSTRASTVVRDVQTIWRDATQVELNNQDRQERQALEKLRQQSESQAHDTQLVENDRAAFQAENVGTEELIRPKLKQTKAEELNKKKRLRDADGKLQSGNTDQISCQCGWNEEEEGNMVYCDWCSTWQHCSCYGFQSASDPRIPREHACYRCLGEVEFRGPARRRLKELKGFALLRRAIRVIETHGFHNDASFAKDLGGCDLQTASEVFARLLSEKAVTLSDSSKTKSSEKMKGSRYYVVTTAPEHSEMMERFFNPLYNIEDYYALESHEFVQKDSKVEISTRATSQKDGGSYTGKPQNSYESATPAGSIGRDPLLERGPQHRPQPEPHEDLNGDTLPKQRSKRKIDTENAEGGSRPPRLTKRTNHGSPAVFTRGMSADH